MKQNVGNSERRYRKEKPSAQAWVEGALALASRQPLLLQFLQEDGSFTETAAAAAAAAANADADADS